MKLTIAGSNLNMPRGEAVFGSLADHQAFLEQAQYRARPEGDERNEYYTGGGFEWTDIRNPRNLVGDRISHQLAAAGDISSLHQSWRSTRAREIAKRVLHPQGGWNDRQNTAKNVTTSLLLAATIPHIGSWQERLGSIQEAAGRKMPVVAYPNEQQPPNEPPRFNFDYPEAADQFAALRYQPTSELLQAWGVLSENPAQTVDDMLAVQSGYGFDEIVWDTKHAAAARSGLSVNEPVEVLRRLTERGKVPEIHLNLTGDPSALRQAMAGNLAGTNHGKMLDAAFGALAADQAISVVTEVTARDFKDVSADTGVTDIAAGNARLVGQIVGIAQAQVN